MGISDLFDIIFSNIAFVVLIIGGLLSVFKRAISDNGNQKRPVNTQPTQKKTTSTSTIPEIEEIPPITLDIEQSEIPPGRQIQNRATTRNREENKPLLEVKRTNRTNKKAPKIDGNINLSSKPKHIIQGVIWSEILGPPRSKSAYRKRF